LKPGGKANQEVTNRLTALFSALGGTPFYCHDKFGWTDDRPDYPGGMGRVSNTIVNLMTAPTLIHNSPEVGNAISDATATGVPPSMFDSDRAALGKHPHCKGWQAAVARLRDGGWFQDPARRVIRRAIASMGLLALERLGTEKAPAKRRACIADIKTAMRRFTQELKKDGGRVHLSDLESN
jgi:hypothetical protein